MEIAEAPEFTCPIGIVHGLYGVQIEEMNSDLQGNRVHQRSLIKIYLHGEDNLGTPKTTKPKFVKVLST